MQVTLPTDGGWLGIADGETFEGFIDWSDEFEEAWELLAERMGEHRVLFWEAANIEAANWSVQVELAAAPAKGVRSATGGLRLSSGKLCVVGWDQLTAVMMDEEVTLLTDHVGCAIVELPPGDYEVTVTQLASPEQLEADDDLRLAPESPHFHIALAPTKRLPAAWDGVRWLSERWHDRADAFK